MCANQAIKCVYGVYAPTRLQHAFNARGERGAERPLVHDRWASACAHRNNRPLFTCRQNSDSYSNIFGLQFRARSFKLYTSGFTFWSCMPVIVNIRAHEKSQAARSDQVDQSPLNKLRSEVKHEHDQQDYDTMVRQKARLWPSDESKQKIIQLRI